MKTRKILWVGAVVALFAGGSVAVSTSASAHVDPTNTSYTLGVLVLKYFPLTADGQNIDTNVTGDYGDTLANARAHTSSVTTNLQAALAEGSRYHGYGDPSARSAITYPVVATIEHDVAVPTVPNPIANGYAVRPNYPSMLSADNICSYVDTQNVREVWIWAYQGPSQLSIDESKMSGAAGEDISNEWVHDPLPTCAHTYTVYTFNSARGTYEAFESHGHQFEYEFHWVNSALFHNLYGDYSHPYPGTGSSPGRCGSVHNPPNATFEYDRNNHTPHASDCLTWYPDGTGTLNQTSCYNWGCDGTADDATPELRYDIWWEQNLPGRRNQVYYSGHRMRNWWDVHGNWDAVWSSGGPLLDLTLAGTASPYCKVTYALNSYPGGFTTNVTLTNTSATMINGWTLAFGFYGNQAITTAWNASYAQNGPAVTLTNASYNATIAPGSSVTLGFQGSWSGNLNAPPAKYTVNGKSCQLA